MNARLFSIRSALILCSIVPVMEACRQIELPDVKIHLMDANDDDWEKELDRRLAGLSKEERERFLLAHIDDKSYFIRFRIYRRLQGNPSVPFWLKALDDSNPDIQSLGISELGRLKAKDAIVPLIKVFEYCDPRSSEAADALTFIGENAVSGLWSSLIQRVGDKQVDQDYRGYCQWTLNKISGEDFSDDEEWFQWGDAHRDKLDPNAIRLLDEMIRERRKVEAARIAKVEALSVSAVPEKAQWRSGEKVMIAVKLTNHGKETLRIAPTSGELGHPYIGPCHAYIQVFDSEGKRAEYDPASMILPPWEINGQPGAPDLDEKDLVSLEPSKSWEATFEHYVMWKPGKCKVVIVYQYDRDYPDGVWRGETQSEPFEVEITNK